MLSLIRTFLGNSRGSLAVITGLSAPALFTLVAVATDYVAMTSIKARLQAAANSAALASVKELGLAGVKHTQIEATAADYNDHNLKESGTLSVAVDIEPEKRTVGSSPSSSHGRRSSCISSRTK